MQALALVHGIEIALIAEVHVEGPGIVLERGHKKHAVTRAAGAEALVFIAGGEGDSGLYCQAHVLVLDEAPFYINADVRGPALPCQDTVGFSACTLIWEGKYHVGIVPKPIGQRRR